MAIFSGLRRLYGAQIDPARLAAAQPFLPDANVGAPEMAQQFRQLQDELERLRTFPAGERVQLDQATPTRGRTSVGPTRDNVIGVDAQGQSGPRPPIPEIMDNLRNHTVDVAEDAADRRRRGINGYGYIPSERDVTDLARALFSEFGRVDNWGDMHAGAAAIINRVRPAGQRPSSRPELGATLQEVLERRLSNGVQQFPFMPPGGIRAPGGHPQWRRSANPSAMRGDELKAFEIAHQIADGLLSGRLDDPTGGAISYRHSRLGTDAQLGGSWTRLIRSPFRSPNNQHIFYRHPDDPPTRQVQKPDFPLLSD